MTQIDPSLDLSTICDHIQRYVDDDQFHYLVTLNPEIWLASMSDAELDHHIRSASIITADGVGIAIAAKILDKSRPKRVTGVDLVSEIIKRQRWSLYLVGAYPGVADTLAKIIRKEWPKTRVLGVRDGFYRPEDESRILDDIVEKSPDIILVAMGTPKQDQFISALQMRSRSGLAIGIGGTFDILTGGEKRAPNWLRRIGGEWIYRAIQNPARLRRWRFIPPFIVCVVAKWWSKQPLIEDPQ